MYPQQNLDSPSLDQDLKTLLDTIEQTAQKYQGNSGALLALLRQLEQVHREIREDLFMPSLPDNRRELAYLIRQIEEKGGWPYIERMRLRSLLVHLEWTPQGSDESLGNG
ncbi:hypothetical protein PN462_06685 [Spirulina sp. CS-785/01]|uniref:hypothetical protein n=1 Tax=Spirulina sp. CS-785/01 TaxID=3021716 RepID=UPI00232B1076|nr:hypothetical protein [Spirulina sp. CS-785/01]MDB9312781.1 hypothetical protein [Spirulina sp. CS-785/01]